MIYQKHTFKKTCKRVLEVKHKIIEWMKRYVPAEILATIGALLGAQIIYVLTGSRILSAYVGTIGDNTFYYGFIIYREIKNDAKHSKNNNQKHGIKGLLKTIRNIIVEFGASEFLDSLLIRPFCMYIFPILLNNFSLGIIVGNMIANVIFYIPTIIAYELRKKHLK